MDTPPAFRDRSRWLWILASLLAVLAVAGVLAYRPAKQLVTTRRAHELVKEGQAALDSRQWQVSAEKARNALRIAPTDPTAIRLAARLLTLNRQAGALTYWEQLVASGKATIEDRQAQVALAQDLSRLDVAHQALEELLRIDAADLSTQELVLGQLGLLGDWRGAAAGARLALKQRPGTPELQFLLGRALLAAGPPESAEEGIEALRLATSSTNAVRRAAIRALLLQPEISPAELDSYAEQLLSAPDAGLSDRLAAQSVRWNLRPGQRLEIVQAVVSFLPAEPSDEELVAVVDWLREHEAGPQAETLIPAAASQGREALFLARVELLADRKAFAEADSFVAQVRTNFPADAIACAAALLAHGKGRSDEVATHLKLALQSAGPRWPRVQFIANYARRLGLPAIALEAWIRLMDSPQHAIPAASQVLASLPDKSYVNEERQAYRVLARLRPDDAEAQAQNAYLDLLCGENIERAAGTFQQLATKFSNSSNLSVGIALGRLRLNRPEGALASVESQTIDWTRSEPHCQAIYAAVLAANQQLRDARTVAARIPREQLRPQELSLIKDLLPQR